MPVLPLKLVRCLPVFVAIAVSLTADDSASVEGTVAAESTPPAEGTAPVDSTLSAESTVPVESTAADEGTGPAESTPTAETTPAAESTASPESTAEGELPRAETLFPQLEPILEAALTQAPSMIQEQMTRLEATYSADADRSVLYPRVGAYGNINFQREDRLSTDSSKVGERSYYSFSASQPLFHWGSLKAQAEIGRIGRLIAERNYTEAYQSLANRIRDAYLQLVAQRVAQRNRTVDLERARSQLEVTKKLAAEGRLTNSAVSTAQYAIEAQVLAGDRADYALDRMLRQFRTLIGDPTFSLDQVPETIPAVPKVKESRTLPMRTEYVTQRGFEGNLAYFRASHSLDIERLNLRIARNQLRPKFNLTAGVSQDVDNRTANVEQRYLITTYYVGLQATWSIWDSKYTKSRVRMFQSRIRRAEKNLEQVEKNTIEAVESAEKELGFATRGLAISERSYTGAESSYRAALDLRKDGRYSDDQVDVALLAYRNAEYSVCEARRDYLRNVANFLAVVQADPLVQKLQDGGRIPR